MPRPVGLPKTGGRQKGAKNKATMRREAALQEAMVALSKEMPPDLIQMLTPKDLLLFVMRRAFEDGHMELALDAAAKAAPYCHARAARVRVDITPPQRTVKDLTDDELEVLAALSVDGHEDGAQAH